MTRIIEDLIRDPFNGYVAHCSSRALLFCSSSCKLALSSCNEPPKTLEQLMKRYEKMMKTAWKPGPEPLLPSFQVRLAPKKHISIQE